MALIQCRFSSEVLGINTSMTVILPQVTGKERHPVLYLLHGYGDDDTAWIRYTSIERYAAESGLAVVMPQVDHSYYTDMEYGKKYWTFLTEEMPVIARSFFPLAEEREKNYVAGLSMGGYGALKWAMNQPDRFSAAASLSGVMDISSWVSKSKESGETKYDHSFGERQLKDTNEDLLYLAEQLDQSDQPKPKFYQCCGTEDFLYENNVDFKKFCDDKSLDFTVEFGPGDHEWGYWDHKIKDVLAWLTKS